MVELMKLLPAMLQPLTGFIDKLAGPATEELGLLFGERVRMYRLKNSLRLFKKTKTMLDDAGIEPTAVPLRTLLPLLEGASLEDNESLSDKWAGLLSAAANSSRGDSVLPSYPHILKCLSPSDVQMLDFMYANEQKGGIVTGADGQEIDRGWTLQSEILIETGMPEHSFLLSFENLAGFGLVQVGGRNFGGTKMTFENKSEVGLTVMGTAFIAACAV